MSTTRYSSEPPREKIAPRHESLRKEFDDRIGPQAPEYGEARLWLVARDAHSLFAYWELNPGEHPEVPLVNGAPQFSLRVLRADGSVETTVQIQPADGDCSVPVRNADAEYTAELGFFTRDGLWCFIAHSGSTLTPPEGGEDDALLQLPQEKLRELFKARFSAKGGTPAERPAGWTSTQEKMLIRLLASESARADRQRRGA
jgi:Domain of unknown function (DUF4912)